MRIETAREKQLTRPNEADPNTVERLEFRCGTDVYGRYAEFNVGCAPVRMRCVEPGHFIMGSPGTECGRMAHETQHVVTITRRFWLADTTCTQLLWVEVMGSNPSWSKGDNRPVEQLSWNDTQMFLATLNERFSGLNLRLPTEAEWEYACRAGTQTPFWFGEEITTENANYNGNISYGSAEGVYRGETVEVRAFLPNPWGFYEVHGNVWEWTQDYYKEDMGTQPVTDPSGPPEGEFKVMRGGCWYDTALVTRSADRDIGKRTLRIPFLGFRFASDDWPAVTNVTSVRIA